KGQPGKANVLIQAGKPDVRQFIAVTCHYDIAEWLEPDWVLDMGGAQEEREKGGKGERERSSVSPSPLLPFSPSSHPSFATSCYQRSCLRRPPLRLSLHRTTAAAWPQFARHHYLSGELNRSAHCYVGVLEGMEQGAGRMVHAAAGLPAPRSVLPAC